MRRPGHLASPILQQRYAPPPALPSQVGNSQNFTQGSYSLFNNAFNAGGLVHGTDYYDVTTYVAATFPRGTEIAFHYPDAPDSSTVIKAFDQLTFGNYFNTNAQYPIQPTQISGITALTFTHDLRFNFPLNGNTCIYDAFLTRYPNGNSNHLWEIEVVLHSPPFTQYYLTHSPCTVLGTTTISGIPWTVYEDPSVNDIIFAPTDWRDVPSATIDFKAMLNYLVGLNVLTGNEYYNGHAFGIEAAKLSGSVFVNNLAVSYVAPVNNNLIGSPSDFSDPNWLQSNVTLLNPGTASQGFLEKTGTASHGVRWDAAVPPTAKGYRVTFDVTAKAVSNLGRDWARLSIYNSDFSGGIDANFNTLGVVTSGGYAYGNMQLTGSLSIVGLGNGVYRCTRDFISDTGGFVRVYISSATGADADNIPGNTAMGLMVDRVTLTDLSLINGVNATLSSTVTDTGGSSATLSALNSANGTLAITTGAVTGASADSTASNAGMLDFSDPNNSGLIAAIYPFY